MCFSPLNSEVIHINQFLKTKNCWCRTQFFLHGCVYLRDLASAFLHYLELNIILQELGKRFLFKHSLLLEVKNAQSLS